MSNIPTLTYKQALMVAKTVRPGAVAILPNTDPTIPPDVWNVLMSDGEIQVFQNIAKISDFDDSSRLYANAEKLYKAACAVLGNPDSKLFRQQLIDVVSQIQGVR